MRTLLLSLLFVTIAPLHSHAQSPADQQDAEAAREKILKASDQLDMIESNSEATKTSVDGMKADLAKLQDENSALKQQLADLQAAFDKSQADHVKERQVLLDEVAKMIASGKPAAAPAKKHTPPAEAEATAPAPTPTAPPPVNVPPPAPDLKPTSNPTLASNNAAPDTAPADPAPAPPAPKPQKGYYHTVESGETLTMITNAYRAKGVNVTIAAVRKANNLSETSVLKVGQKLFIPKPGA